MDLCGCHCCKIKERKKERKKERESPNWIAGPRWGGGGKVGSRRGRTEGAELEGEKILLGRKVFLLHCQPTPPSHSHIGLSPSIPSPLHPFYSPPPARPPRFSPSDSPPSPPPHPDIIRNQQKSIRCIKGRSGS
jgi:hypothetical protein